MKKIFTPMFKTKANSEKPVIKAFLNSFNDTVMPFIEFIRFVSGKAEKKIIELLSEKTFFAQYYKFMKDDNKKIISNSSLNNQINGFESLINISEKVIPVIYLERDSLGEIERIVALINDVHSKNRKIGIRYFGDIENDISNDTIEEIKTIFAFLSESDYFFYDVGDDYEARLFDRIHLEDFKNRTNIIILCCERKYRLKSKKEFPEYSFAGACFDTSLLSDYLNDNLVFGGFGTYCGLEDSLTEEQSHSYMVYGLLTIYDSKTNSFFSIRSDRPDWNSKACKPLKEKINNKWLSDLKPSFFNETTNFVSLYEIENLLSNEEKSGNHSTYIRIGLEKYLEEVINYIN